MAAEPDRVVIRDIHALLREAAQGARGAGLHDAADELESRTTAAVTTSSEFLGEVGLAIRQFRKSTRGRVPPEVDRALDECLREVRKVWPWLR